MSSQALSDKRNGIVSSIRQSVEIVKAAGPVTVFVATLADRSTTPAFQAAFPDPVKRQRVTDAIIAINTDLRTMAAQLGATIVDVFAFGDTLLARIDTNGNLNVGGELISLSVPGDEPHHLLLGDNEHSGTVGSGLLANLFIGAFNAAGLNVNPFSDTEILNNAGILQDAAAPLVSLTSPLDGATVSGSVAVSATASDDVGVVGVQFKLDGANLGAEDTSAPYAATWTTTASQNGVHTLTAVARDASGKTGTAPLATLTVNNLDSTPPSVSLTSPANGAQVSGSLTVSASASDNVGVAGVTFLRDGNPLGPEDTTAPYSITVQTNPTQNGAWTLVARARDAAGNQTSSAPRSITVANALSSLVNPGGYSVTRGTYQSGSAASLVSDDGNFLVIKSASSGTTGYTRADFDFTGIPSTATSLALKVIAKSSASSTTLRLYAYQVTTGTWVQLQSTSLGTGEATKNVSITSGVSAYRDASGVVRLRVEGSRIWSTFTLSHELVSVTVTH